MRYLKMIKKFAVIAATLFFGGMCAGFFLYEYVAENVQAQIEESK